ncbi:hypothetical protein GVN18_38115 [Pseudomonas sp. ODNR1LW]|nr:hypothetical protein [Pseudomonas sp. ODNR1LW]
MSDLTLEQLKQAESRLVRALSDPTKAVFYDDFKQENRPISEIQDALAAIRAEITAQISGRAPTTLVIRPVRIRNDY